MAVVKFSASKLGAQMEKAGVTVEMLARGAKIHPVDIQRLLQNDRRIDYNTVFNLAMALRCSPNKLIVDADASGSNSN